ncbi:MAG: TolC family protein [Candidatus Krumholzibacteriota bacterium]|nr:TolC family protein [Candidatus Krumholzibacteriota bacterium]
MFSEQEPIDGPVTLYEAMARAIMYNLDHRVEVMSQAVSQHQLDVARYDLLPSLVAGIGLPRPLQRERLVVQNVETGRQSLAPSTSTERDVFTADLNLAWNVLDFGVNYFTAQQQADRAMIAYERRRKVIHGIIQDVRCRLLAGGRRPAPAGAGRAAIGAGGRRAPGTPSGSSSCACSRRWTRSATSAPCWTPSASCRPCARTWRWRRWRLATLMNLPPDRDFELAMPASEIALGELALSPQELEQIALAYRPELREEDSRPGCRRPRRARRWSASCPAWRCSPACTTTPTSSW